MKILQEYWASMVIFIGIFPQCGRLVHNYCEFVGKSIVIIDKHICRI